MSNIIFLNYSNYIFVLMLTSTVTLTRVLPLCLPTAHDFIIVIGVIALALIPGDVFDTRDLQHIRLVPARMESPPTGNGGDLADPTFVREFRQTSGPNFIVENHVSFQCDDCDIISHGVLD